MLQMFYLTLVLFSLLKSYARLVVRICFRTVVVNKPEWLQAKGPLLLACNHPNSFLDGLLLTVLFEDVVYSLARGDAFRKSWHGKVLRWMHLLPVYRTSEGVENLEANYTTFKACKEVFRQGGIVIIFSEGRCINEWHLRPLRKGTARLATSAWEEGIRLTVLPVGLNYSAFRTVGQNVLIHFGQPLNREEVMAHQTDGKMFLTFNDQLRSELEKLVFEIDPADRKKQRQLLSISLPLWKVVLLSIPALVGFLVHTPLYFMAKAVTKILFDNDHFDSVLASIIMLAYPFFLLLCIIILVVWISWFAALAVGIGLPFTAWACVQLKPQR